MRPLVLGALISALAVGAHAQPADGGWPALVSDRSAAHVGDSLTVLIFESATASNVAQRGTKKASRIAGAAQANNNPAQRGELSLTSTFDGQGQTTRSDRLVASVSAVVVGVLPNGDLRVAGQETLNVNGERTLIRVAGRVRPSDITGENTVLSTRLAEADIVYDGQGFNQRASKPGILTRVLQGLGVF